jgi:dihydroorotate dehydrogenase (fumarate)
MDLRTSYLGLDLPHPFMPGASPLPDGLDMARRLEDAGASAIVMRSLFEEQILQEEISAGLHVEGPMESYAEALSYFPDPSTFRLGPFEYLEHVRRLRQALALPLIASLNGTTLGGWLEYAQYLEDAGADALELNVYRLPVSAQEDALAVEQETAEMVVAVKRTVRIPVAVKVSPFYTSLPAFAARLAGAGADGLVLFNRFLQPDIDVEELRAVPLMELSHPSELRLRLRWLAILSGGFPGSLACSGGVHDTPSAVKALMAGADVVQVVSALLLRGPQVLAELRTGLAAWLVEHEYASLAQLRGSMSLAGCPDPKAYERAHYMRVLQSRQGD